MIGPCDCKAEILTTVQATLKIMICLKKQNLFLPKKLKIV